MHPQNQPGPLKITFTRLDPKRHRMTIVRADGSTDSRELETRSFLQHDLIHFAVEIEAGLRGGFFGGLAAGARLGDPGVLDAERLAIEQVVGAFTGAQKEANPPAPEVFAAAVNAFIATTGGVPPAWLNAAYVTAVRERLRGLEGRWRATTFGEPMLLEF